EEGGVRDGAGSGGGGGEGGVADGGVAREGRTEGVMSGEVTRRDFLAALGGAGILILCEAEAADAQESGRRSHSGDEHPRAISAWLHIGEDGRVSVYTGKTEVGQNIRTSLAQAVAEELRAPLASIRLVMADTDLTPYDMGTFGSRTTPTMAPELRKAARAAREALAGIAAAKWSVARTTVQVSNGKVFCAGHSAGFGELTKGQQLVENIRPEMALAPATEWQVAGRSTPKVDARELVTGKHRYTPDVK